MNCPICNGETKVKDSRPDEDSVRRRRECLVCQHRFSTVEIDVDLFATMKPRNKNAFRAALLDGYAELTNRLYRALGFESEENNV